MPDNHPINRREFMGTALAASAATNAWSQARRAAPPNPNEVPRTGGVRTHSLSVQPLERDHAAEEKLKKG
jgi:hypothetical protein